MRRPERCLITLVSIILTLSVLSCGTNNGSSSNTSGNHDNEDVLSVFKKMADSAFDVTSAGEHDSAKVYIVLPSSGCPGCITSIERLLVDFTNGKYPVRLILTNIVSIKILRLKLGESVVTSRNVYIDKSNSFYNKETETQKPYPLVFYVDHSDDHFMKAESVNPENPQELKRLYDFLAIKY